MKKQHNQTHSVTLGILTDCNHNLLIRHSRYNTVDKHVWDISYSIFLLRKIASNTASFNRFDIRHLCSGITKT